MAARSYHRLPDGTTWPTAERAAEFEHLLRYGTPTRSDLLAAASVLSAYVHLATHPMGTEKVIRQVRMLRRAEAALSAPDASEAPDGTR